MIRNSRVTLLEVLSVKGEKMDSLRLIAERKIAKAIQEGTLNIEGWKGKPLPMEDDHLVPDDLKMAYKILKNSGFLPPEIEAKKEIHKLEEMIAQTEDEHVRVKQIKKLNFLLTKLNCQRNRPVNLEEHGKYQRKVVEKITVKRPG